MPQALSKERLERQSVSAPPSTAVLQENARLVARSWNFRVKTRHKYSTTNLDRPLTEGGMKYNYDSTYTQAITKNEPKITNLARSLAKIRRSDVAVIPINDVEHTFDELFDREVVQIPPRMELATQSSELNKLIAKAQAASSYSLSKSLQPLESQPQLETHRIRRHASLAKLLSNENCDELEVSDEKLEPESMEPAVDTNDIAHLQAKYRCLMNRDVNFIRVLPQMNNYPLATLIGEAWKTYNDGQYNECLDQIKKCFILNTSAVNRPSLFFNQAVVLAHLGHFSEAMIDLNEAIKLDPEVSRYYKLRSVIWRVKEQYIEASKDSKRAASIDQNKADHKHVHQLARRALKTISIVNASSKEHHVPSKKDLFEDAYETPPGSRTPAQLDHLIDQSSRIPCLAKLQHDILHALWRNLNYANWAKDSVVHVAKFSLSLYIILEGTVAVQTNNNGVKEIHQMLQPGNVFGESTISVNLWPQTTLEAITACKVLTLEHNVYKHTLKKVMMDGASKRAEFFTTTGIFSEWTEEQRNTLGVLSENMDFSSGEIIVNEGSPATHLYFVQSGMCGAVRILGEEKTRIQVATLSSGDVFGEAAVLDPINGVLPFTIIANTICKIIRVEKHYLNKRTAFELLRLGPMTKNIMNKIQRFSVRCPHDRLLVQMIRDNCTWKLERKKVLKEFAKDLAKAHGKLSLPKVQNESYGNSISIYSIEESLQGTAYQEFHALKKVGRSSVIRMPKANEV